MFGRIIGFALLASSLAACTAGDRLRDAQSLKGGPGFSGALHEQYVMLAENEYDESDNKDTSYFADKAIAAARQGDAQPTSMEERRIPRIHRGELTSAYNQLRDARAGDARERAPAELARAQAMFDCWMQEQEENLSFQKSQIAACRRAFKSAMSNVAHATAAPAPAPQPSPRAVPTPAVEEQRKPQEYTVYFDFDSERLDQDALRVLASILVEVDVRGSVAINVDGHADRAGPSDYNQALSDRRVEAVVSFLVASGIRRGLITTKSLGEAAPAVATADGVREPRNRRAHIVVD